MCVVLVTDPKTSGKHCTTELHPQSRLAQVVLRVNLGIL